ncbi:hypothetical protein Clacol_006375 [Clathrus columnatus]|uniref:BTB domain-containing protein n=1 Tax=Clathrus columnatus TaxID=1419009 RepID=A0AAV5ABX6_9AGAM|nr:hypothetical protein Clacol_006375 [Clathrus columnatus]
MSRVFSMEPNSSQYFHLLSLAEQGQHPHFWFHDGDTVLSADGVYFRVHSVHIVPLSEILLQFFQDVPKLVHPQALYFLPQVKGGPLAWSCLLGLLYNKEKAVVNPSLGELLSITRLSIMYQFTRLKLWALACMRRDFFKDPEYMQIDSEETVEEKLENAINVFQAWWFPRFDLNNRTLAIYALARLDLSSYKMRQLQRDTLPQSWRIIAAARRALDLRYIDIVGQVAAIGAGRRDPSKFVAHSPSTCQKSLLNWMQDARGRDSDILRIFKRLQNAIPLGPVCRDCIHDARTFLRKAYEETSRNLPIYMGCHEQIIKDWTINQVLLDADGLLCPV